MQHIGLIGLGTMGANLARNAARKGATVSVYNRTHEKTTEFMSKYSSEGTFITCATQQDFLSSLPAPRTVFLMVKAGDAIDSIIHDLLPGLSAGDILVDAGNSHYKDTDRREKLLQEKGISFVGMGVSGGEEGALLGPSMMPGGPKEACDALLPLLQSMAASDGDGGKCVAYMGPGGAGHFVKMVHNGIEYGVMQLIAEVYHLLKAEGGFTNEELAQLFSEWNKDVALSSFLLEITAKIFKMKDIESGKDLLDVILDKAGQKGTGKWTTDAALTYGVSVPTITAAVDARIVSSGKDFRVQRSKITPFAPVDVGMDKDTLKAKVRDALELSISHAYAQGFQLLGAASTEEKWNLNASEIARIWRGGCIIRSTILAAYQRAFTGNEQAAKQLRARLEGDRQMHWREIVAIGALKGIPLPAMSASLNYFDGYRTERLPQNLVQAQRDFFGAHTYERTDKPGMFHTHWN